MIGRRLSSMILIAPFLVFGGSTQSASSRSPETQTISLENIGVAFELPKKYSMLQREKVVEGRYAVTISFGRAFRPGHFKTLDVYLVFWPGAYDGRRSIPQYKPSQYVDVEYRKVEEGYRKQLPGGFDSPPEYITLFGNKAVQYTLTDFLCCVIAVGYLRPDQLSGRAAKHGGEYLVRITMGVWTNHGTDEVFDALVKSLRVIR